MEHLQKMYPGIMPDDSLSKMKGTTIDKRLAYFCKALISVRDSWTKSHQWMNKFIYDENLNVENTKIVEQFVFTTLDCMIKAARELFDMPDEEDLKKDHSVTDSASCPLELNGGCIKHGAQNPSLFNQKNGQVEELKPDYKEVQSISEVTPAATSNKVGCSQNTNEKPKPHISNMNELSSEEGKGAESSEPGNQTAPLVPLMMPSKGSVQSVPPPMMPTKQSALPPPKTMPPLKQPGPPPPPPLGATKFLHRKAATTKLKRSTRMSNLFQNLKRSIEGSGKDANSANGRKAPIGTRQQIEGSTGWKEGLGASLAELKKRSPYFHQVEEDVRKNQKSIIELKIAINSFQAKDMVKLLKFQTSVESFLEGLTDETQVLTKFEDFPTKKLESLRTAAALYSKLDTIVCNLKRLEIVAPLNKLFGKVEGYFNKFKKELDAIERTKDEESTKFKRHDIHFDFNILTRIKELMVDISSSCLELVLKETKEAKAAKDNGENVSKTDAQKKENAKMLWRAFQLAYRVYIFAGGQDDRANKLTEEVAHEITVDSQQQ
ncbi:uncharacterized protein At4g04980-like isoform X2 [Juglans regia]|nr:uncharacterized protein At4g04980-like isoform X2 [Juglans regia]